jgi:hypothetical protein
MSMRKCSRKEKLEIVLKGLQEDEQVCPDCMSSRYRPDSGPPCPGGCFRRSARTIQESFDPCLSSAYRRA